MRGSENVFSSIQTPWKYVTHLLTISSQFQSYLLSYLLFHLTILCFNLINTTLLDQLLYLHSSTTISLILICCFISSIFLILARHFLFYFTNLYLKRKIWSVSIQDILMNLLSIHPLWLTSSSVSGNTLREVIVDFGLGAITNCLNRMSYFGPMIFDLLTSVWRLGVLNISIASTFVFLLGILHFHIFLPYSDHYSKIRDEIVRIKRKRFLVIERIEYSNLQKCRTRFADFSILFVFLA
jgi:hypothetical protein